jgi:hypothetical protein
MELSRDAAPDKRPIHRGLEAMQPVRLRDRWSGLPVVIHLWRQCEPGYMDSSQIESAGGGKAVVSTAPTATPQTARLRSPSQYSVLPQFGQK